MTASPRSCLGMALCALVAATAASGQEADTATPNILAGPSSDLEPSLKRIPLSSLKATRERPLFSPSRRPAETVVDEPPPSPAPAPPPPPPDQEAPRPNLTLVGTVMTGRASLAIFTDAATQDTIRMRKGEEREGWTLASIDRRSATLKNGDQVFTLEFPANVEAPEAPEPAADDDTPVPAWQARHEAAANGATPLRPPPGSAPTQTPPILRRHVHP